MITLTSTLESLLQSRLEKDLQKKLNKKFVHRQIFLYRLEVKLLAVLLVLVKTFLRWGQTQTSLLVSSSDCYLDLLLICIWICHIDPHTNFVGSGFVELGTETTICVTHIVDQQIC